MGVACFLFGGRMKGDASCHTSNPRYRDGYDEIFKCRVNGKNGAVAWIVDHFVKFFLKYRPSKKYKAKREIGDTIIFRRWLPDGVHDEVRRDGQ